MYRKKLIDVALPLDAINAAAAREKSIRHGHPSTLHLWWARRPLAAARAVIFAQLVDDPSVVPEEFPTPEAQERERRRLFRLIEQLVQWENTTNEALLEEARAEIRRSWARHCLGVARVAAMSDADIRAAFDSGALPPLPAFHDPFAGGGSLPLEAQRLGLEAYASDLNPVAVLITKAMIEIPPKFAGRPPVNPEARSEWREVRSEREERKDALPGDDTLAEGDGGGAGDVSSCSVSSTGRDVWHAITDHTSSGLDSSEYRRGLDPRDKQGQGAFSGNRAGIAGGSGDSGDPLRRPGVVPYGRDPQTARIAGRGKPDADVDAAQTPGGGARGEEREARGEGRGVSAEEREALEIGDAHSSLLFPLSYKGAQGLAEDVRYYGQWMRTEAEKRIGHLYPKVKAWQEPRSGQYFGEPDVLEWQQCVERDERCASGEHVARVCGYTSLASFLSALTAHELTVIAWLWARTVRSPNPAFAHIDVPLASTFMLSTDRKSVV